MENHEYSGQFEFAGEEYGYTVRHEQRGNDWYPDRIVALDRADGESLENVDYEGLEAKAMEDAWVNSPAKSSTRVHVPVNAVQADQVIGRLNGIDIAALPREDFLKLWYAFAYLNLGLHPDGYEAEDSGRSFRQSPLAQEAWRRALLGDMADEELYPADAAWAGVCDQLAHPPEAVR